MCDKCSIDQEIDTDRKNTRNQSSNETKIYNNNELDDHYWINKFKTKFEDVYSFFETIPIKIILNYYDEITSIAGENEDISGDLIESAMQKYNAEIQKQIKMLIEYGVEFDEVCSLMTEQLIYDGKNFIDLNYSH